VEKRNGMDEGGVLAIRSLHSTRASPIKGRGGRGGDPNLFYRKYDCIRKEFVVQTSLLGVERYRQ